MNNRNTTVFCDLNKSFIWRMACYVARRVFVLLGAIAYFTGAPHTMIAQEQIPEINVAENLSDEGQQLKQDLEKELLTVSTGPVGEDQFVNPIGEGADPWVIRDPNADRYLWCFSAGNRGIAIHTTTRLTSLGRTHVVWQAPETGPVSQEVWAPELHYLDDKWHVYFAASDGRNENHLAYVLVSQDSDPLGSYTLHGPLETGDEFGKPIWAIDMTVLEQGGQRYALWSGWDLPGSDQQFLYIAPMKSPTELAALRVLLCPNDDFPWEFTEDEGRGRGLNEAPQVLQTGKQTLVLYSCGASWLPTYKLGQLQLVGDDPLNPKAWQKLDRPVFASSEATYGVGHSCFVQSPDASQWWHVFHAKRDREPGWRRAVHMQPMQIDSDGFPDFTAPVAAGVPWFRPSGEPTFPELTLPVRDPLDSKSPWLDHWSPYGHQQMIKFAESGLHLGWKPEQPINTYRSGEKVVLDRQLPADMSIKVLIDFRGNKESRDAGVLFRTSGVSVGYDAQRGYFIGLIPKSNLLVFGKMDGQNWEELARVETAIDTAVSQSVQVQVVGDRIRGFHNGRLVLDVRDPTYSGGQVGLRVVDTYAVFSDLELDAVDE